MSKAQRWKQQQKDKKNAKNPQPTKPKDVDDIGPSKSQLKQQKEANRAALRAHQASMAKVRVLQEKIHGPLETQPAQEKSALQDMFYDGANLSKDAARTTPLTSQGLPNKNISPLTGSRSVAQPVSHEKDTSIKPGP